MKLWNAFGQIWQIKKIIAYQKLVNKDYSEMKKAREPWNL